MKKYAMVSIICVELLFVSNGLQNPFISNLSWGDQKYKVEKGSLITMEKLDPVPKYQD